MSVVVRAHEHGASMKLIQEALKPLTKGSAALAFVSVGDIIDTDETDVYLK
jgi:hypothetical protein